MTAAASSPAALPSEWRDIASAPSNEDILAFFPDASEWAQVMICHFLRSDDPADAGDWYEQNVDLCPGPLEVEPTHWQPLPAPPIVADSPDLNRPMRSASDMAIACARLALARIANGDPQAMRLAKVALGDIETLVPEMHR